MNIDDIKERIAANPNAEIDFSELDAEGRSTVEAFRMEMLSLDARIARALDVPVPELRMPELPPIEQDDDNNVVQMPRSNKWRLTTPEWIGIAASIALLALIGTRSFDGADAYPSLAAEVVAHLAHEPGALRVTDEAVAERQVVNVVNSGGASLQRELGLITYAKSCVINGKEVPHLVMQGKSGPITLLLMPGEKISEAVPLEGHGVKGVILPVGTGSIAIIGESDSDLADAENRVVDSISWTI